MTNVFYVVNKQYKTLTEEVNADAEYGGLTRLRSELSKEFNWFRDFLL